MFDKPVRMADRSVKEAEKLFKRCAVERIDGSEVL